MILSRSPNEYFEKLCVASPLCTKNGVVHTVIKANNVLIDWEEETNEIVVEQLQVADIEDAAYIPDNCGIQEESLETGCGEVQRRTWLVQCMKPLICSLLALW